MVRIVICPYCGFNLPLRRHLQYCPVCDERIGSNMSLPEYRPLKPVDYSAPAPPPVAILAPGEVADERDAEAEAMTLVVLLELRPWYLRTWFIVLMLFGLTPLGLVLLWTQQPRVGALGGPVRRSLLTLAMGGVWCVLAVAALSSDTLPRTVEHLAAQVVQQITQLEQARPSARVTRAAYNRLKPGNSRDAVIALLGRESRRIAQARIGGDSSQTLSLEMEALEWRNPDGSLVELTFENGRLAKKVEYGLQ